jgi:hypothetical protein
MQRLATETHARHYYASDRAIRLITSLSKPDRIYQGRRTFMTIRIALIAFVLVGTCGSLRAEDGTPAQRRACRPDVLKLCSEWIPKHDAITYCLQKNIERLSRDCRAVMEGKLR